MEGPTPEHKETEAGRSSEERLVFSANEANFLFSCSQHLHSMEDSGGSLPRPLYEYEMRTINHYQQQRATELLRDEQISTSMKARYTASASTRSGSTPCLTTLIQGTRVC